MGLGAGDHEKAARALAGVKRLTPKPAKINMQNDLWAQVNDILTTAHGAWQEVSRFAPGLHHESQMQTKPSCAIVEVNDRWQN